MIRSSLLTLLMVVAAPLAAQQPLSLLGSPCTPAMDQPVTEPETGRTFILDYPCDLQTDEEVTLILNLHGGGSNTSYQHAYFPAFEQKEKYRLVIATPYSPTRRWSEVDDAYLENIVSQVTDALGHSNVRAFWLAGHSQGGATSRRLICTDFFSGKVDGFLSLSGGRVGGVPDRSPNAGRPRQEGDPAPEPAATPAAPAAPAAEPDCDFSHIYAIGEYEIVSLPDSSEWANKYGCSAAVRREDVVDTVAGYTYDRGHQNPATREWGREARPGTARVIEYPGCNDGRVVADVVRMDKGHTEGLEPLIVEELVKLMTAARGGKIQQGG